MNGGHIAGLLLLLDMIYEVPAGADMGLGFQHQEESRISLLEVRLLSYRLQ